MSTFELLIVFAALIAVIALVAIAIDWVGRPLRNRRFVPRIYRYEDELHLDPRTPGGYGPIGGNAVPVPAGPPVAAVSVAPPPLVQPPPAVVATLDAAAAEQPDTQHAAASAAQPPGNRTQGVELPDNRSDSERASASAFAEALAEDDDELSTPRGVAQTIPVAAAPSWHPGMALDARAGDRKPTVTVKAERYWRATAAQLGADSHFGERNRERMAGGKPPRRLNPRTGDVELMELVGLRAAAAHEDVRMRWPDTAVDPWSPS